MGVTKQAAQKRFVPKGHGESSEPHQSQGFSRFTKRARSVLTAAQDAARAAGNDEIGVGHLVLGLLSEPEALAARAIVAQGVSLDRVRETATKTLPTAAQQVPELIPYDSQARKTLELTYREALRMGHNYIGTEHILLALLEVEDGTGVLAGLGVDKATVEANITAAVAAVARKRD
jgi:ATP-dependent Clp protease ATP-binding subunit ClpA